MTAVSTVRRMAMGLSMMGALAAPAGAQAPGSRQTRDYVQSAGESDTFEKMEAYSALAESRDPQVIAFARAMIRDHGKTSDGLRDATARAGLEPPPMAVGAGQSPFLASLQSAQGHEFDKTYWQQQVLGHRTALTVTQQYAASGDVAAIRQAAMAAVPVVARHLAMAERMKAKTEGGS